MIETSNILKLQWLRQSQYMLHACETPTLFQRQRQYKAMIGEQAALSCCYRRPGAQRRVDIGDHLESFNLPIDYTMGAFAIELGAFRITFLAFVIDPDKREHWSRAFAIAIQIIRIMLQTLAVKTASVWSTRSTPYWILFVYISEFVVEFSLNLSSVCTKTYKYRQINDRNKQVTNL